MERASLEMTLAVRVLEPSVGGRRGAQEHDEANGDGQLWVDGVHFTSVRLLGLRLRRLTFSGTQNEERKEGDDGGRAQA